jgi:hypothetical protein
VAQAHSEELARKEGQETAKKLRQAESAQKKMEAEEAKLEQFSIAVEKATDKRREEMRQNADEELKECVLEYLASPERPKDTAEIIARRDPVIYKALVAETLDDDDDKIPDGDHVADGKGYHEATDDGISSNPVSPVQADLATVPAAVVCDDTIEKEEEEEDDEDEDINLLSFAKGGVFDRFEDSLWEVELTESAIKWFKKNIKGNQRLCRNVVTRLRTLSKGYWNERTHKQLSGTKINLFESNLSKGQRILWEVAVNLSERLNSFETDTTAASKIVHSEMIRVWAIVDKHDMLPREVKKVESSHRRGQTCLVQQTLHRISSGETAEARMLTHDQDGTEQRVPATFFVDEASSGAAAAAPRRHYHLGSSNPNEFALLKFYSFNSHMLGCLFGHRSSESSLPFKMTSKEYEIARLKHEQPVAILLMGRSGTGKTSVQCYRLATDWESYWKTCVDGEPRLPLPPSKPSSTTSGTPHTEEELMSHLRQLFVTKSMCLRTEVQRVSRDLMRGSGSGIEIADDDGGVEGLSSLSGVPTERWPLFATLSEVLLLLDRTLPGECFLRDAGTGGNQSAELSGIEAYFGGVGDDDNGGILHGEGGDDDGEDEALDVTGLGQQGAQSEMTWVTFLNKVR